MTERLSVGLVARPSLAQRVFAWFRRVVAVGCLVSGVIYWGRIVGAPDFGAPGAGFWRFDLMALHWQVASVSLAVFFPFAAIGLWMLASWGPVVWLICAGAEVAMYWGRPDLFGTAPLAVAAHLAAAIVYATLRLLILVQKRRAEVSGY